MVQQGSYLWDGIASASVNTHSMSQLPCELHHDSSVFHIPLERIKPKLNDNSVHPKYACELQLQSLGSSYHYSCLYVCMYVCMYVCVYVCMYVYI